MQAFKKTPAELDAEIDAFMRNAGSGKRDI